MTVDPQNETITVDEVVSALSTSIITGGGTQFQIRTSNIVWNGVDTVNGDIELKWLVDSRLENASIRVVGGNAAAANAVIVTDDAACGGTLAAVLPGCNPGNSYVADVLADGPETELEILFTTQTERKSRIKRVICPMCGTVTSPWEFFEPGGGSYTFYAKVFGAGYGYGVLSDSRYDVNTASVKTQTYLPDPADSTNPDLIRTSPINNVASGQWVYANVWYDYPGNSRSGVGLCADGDGSTSCSITPDVWENYDYYFVEDQDNFDAQPSGWSTSAYYNTSFTFMGGGSYRMQWDPAVLQTNDDEDATCGIGSGALSFKTNATCDGGSRLTTYADEDALDQMQAGTASSSNWRNIVFYSFTDIYNYGTGSVPPMPDGTDTYGDSRISGNFVQGDANMGRLSIKAIGAAGEGSRLSMSPSGNTILYAALGLGSDTNAGQQRRVIQKSANYPIWGDATGYGEGPGASAGHYNEQLGYLCIQ